MKQFDLSLLDGYDSLKEKLTDCCNDNTYEMYYLIEHGYNKSLDIHNPNFYPETIINKWFSTSSTSKNVLIHSTFKCLKRCDEETFQSLYGREYNPLSVSLSTIPNVNYRIKDKKGNLMYSVTLHVDSIDDAGLVIRKCNLTLDEANKIVLDLIDFVDLMDLLSLDTIEKYSKENNFEIDRY